MVRGHFFVPALIALGCRGEHAPPRPTPPTSPPATTALVLALAPEVVGKITPVAPVAGDYAMALSMTFSNFVTMEMRIDERRTGALTMSLVGDGTARACLASRGNHVVDGQYHYEPDPKLRQHHSSEDVRLLGLGGSWSVLGGVATVQFDRMAQNTCELATAMKLDKAIVELHCVGIGTTDRVPAGSLVCEATEKSDLLGLGMPMTVASRSVPDSPARPTPSGRNLVLGAPGLVVEVVQGSNSPRPTFTFTAGAVKLVEADYQPKK